MAFDIHDHFAMMDRRVATGERDGQETVIVYAGRTYATDPSDLWDALTTAERLSRWFLPVSGELKLGGRYQFEGNAGGTIESCDPPERIRATWEYAGGVSWVTLTLTPRSDGTHLELAHEAHLIPGFTDRFGPGAVGVGWDLGFLGLAQHLNDPTVDARPESGVWETSPEALAFYRSASERWGEAAIENGEPVEEARAAAENTRAFYSGEAAGMAGGAADDGTPDAG